MKNDPNLTETPKHPLVEWLETKKSRIEEYCTKGITADQLCRTFSTAILRDTRKDIEKCTRESIVLAVSYAARLGLDPTGERNGAHFIAYKNNKLKITELKLQLGYGALIDLIIRNSEIMDIQTEVVYEGEHFEVLAGTENRIEHRPDMKIRYASNYERVIAAYCIATYPNGHKKFQVLDRKKLNKIQSTSKANDSVWNYSPEEMARKSTVRNLSKWLSIGPEFNEAIAISDDADGYEDRSNCSVRSPEQEGAPVASVPEEDTSPPPIVETEFTVNPEPPAEPEQEIDDNTGESVPPPSADGDTFADDLLADMDSQTESRKL